MRERLAGGYRIVCAVALALLSGCVAVSTATRAPAHPLLGVIHDVKGGVLISRDALLAQLVSADFILLGETHDNPEQHRLQAELLRALIAQGRRPALAMEQFDRDHQPAIDEAIARGSASDEVIADAGRFNRKGWQWLFYAPLLAIAAEARLPVVALNLSRERTREIARDGFTALGADAAARLALDRGWTPSKQTIQQKEIDDGHCGQLPASALPRMVNLQRARDATMADALLQRAEAGAVVIAGKGHVRNDVGVPLYLSVRAPAKKVISVGFIEVDPDRRATGDYGRPPGSGLPFDYVWFTTAAEREDPCAGLVMPQRP